LGDTVLTVTDANKLEVLDKDNFPLVNMDISYPVLSGGNKKVRLRINRFYEKIAEIIEQFARNELLNCAAIYSHTLVNSGGAFRPSEVRVRYTVTYNDAEYFSLYREIQITDSCSQRQLYKFGDTWDLKTGWLVTLKDFFEPNAHVRKKLCTFIEERIDHEMRLGYGQYLESSQRSIRRMFDMQKFYLTTEGIVLFFDPGTIAPKHCGTPAFVYNLNDCKTESNSI
jgi:hypothetical protein